MRPDPGEEHIPEEHLRAIERLAAEVSARRSGETAPTMARWELIADMVGLAHSMHGSLRYSWDHVVEQMRSAYRAGEDQPRRREPRML